MTNKLKILVVEDDENDCNALIREINENPDKLCLAGVTKSSNEALDFIRSRKPDAVILDLELQEGCGDGMELLDKLHSTLVYPKPYIIVNTNNSSKVTGFRAKQLGADYAFAKWQENYSPKTVINHLLLFLPVILNDDEQPPSPLNQCQLENLMRSFLQDEFNKLGVNVKNKGYNYLVDAVILAVREEKQSWTKIIGAKFGKSENCISHAIKYAINNTWTTADINNLQKYYTATLRKNKLAPTVYEFIFFYKQKLITYLNK